MTEPRGTHKSRATTNKLSLLIADQIFQALELRHQRYNFRRTIDRGYHTPSEIEISKGTICNPLRSRTVLGRDTDSPLLSTRGDEAREVPSNQGMDDNDRGRGEQQLETMWGRHPGTENREQKTLNRDGLLSIRADPRRG